MSQWYVFFHDGEVVEVHKLNAWCQHPLDEVPEIGCEKTDGTEWFLICVDAEDHTQARRRARRRLDRMSERLTNLRQRRAANSTRLRSFHMFREPSGGTDK